MKRSRIGVALLVVAVIASACGQTAGEDTTTTAVTTSVADTTPSSVADDKPATDDVDVPVPNPTSITVTPDDDGAVTAEIGPDGGTMEVTTDDGVVFTVSIPVGALVDTVAITATPVTGAGVLDGAPHAALRLEPEGLILYAPATITFTNPLSDAAPVGFGASASGEDFHLRPLWGDGQEIVTHHFSTYGVTWGDQVKAVMDDNGYVPESIESTAQQLIATSEAVGASPYAGVTLLARTIRQRLNGSGTASELERGLIDVLTVGLLIVRTSGLTDEAPPEQLLELHRELVRIWFARVDTLVQRAAAACQTDPLDAFFVIGWVFLGTSFTLTVGQEDFDALGIGADRHAAEAALLEQWVAIAENCLQFEVTWDATVELVTGNDSSRVVTTARAILDDWEARQTSLTLPLRISGMDENRVTSFSFEGCDGLGYNTTPGSATVTMDMLVTLDEPNRVQTALLDGYRVSILPGTPPEVRCKPAIDSQTFQPNWGTLFYATPLSLVNASRASRYGWTFGLEPNSGTVTGSIAATIERDSQTIEGTLGTVDQEIQLYHRPGG